jgi:putative peptidoglycan binding protein
VVLRLYLKHLQAFGSSVVLLAGFAQAQQPAAEPAAQKPASATEKARVVPASTAKTHTKSGTSHTKSSAKTGSSTAKSHTSSGKTQTSSRRRHSGRKGSWKRKGQQAIQPERAREIQEALIREHYLTGEATGTWDARTEAAMLKYQADNGWQSKVTPDSRALIKLGLGPDYSKQSLNSAGAKSDAVAANSSGGSSAGTDK